MAAWIIIKDCTHRGIPFLYNRQIIIEKEFYMGIEHGMVGNTHPVNYRSVAFYYLDKP